MLLMTITFFVLMLAGAPVAFFLGMAAVPYLLLQGDLELTIIPQQQFVGLDSFLMVALPFFLLASNLMNEGGITERIVDMCNKVIGHIRGGLAHVAIVACMIISGLSGMAMSDAAAIGQLMIPSMKKEGYEEAFACAVVSSAAVNGPIIPPSFLFVLYCLVAGGVSLGALFLAGLIPGVLICIANMVVAGYYAHRFKYPIKKRASMREVIVTFFRVLPAAMVPIIMIGGMVFGVFTPTEAACVAVLVAYLVAFVFLREFTFSKAGLRRIFKMIVDTGVTVGSLQYILSGAMIFAWVLTSERIPHQVAEMITNFSNNPTVILLIINAFLLVVGCFMDPTPSMLILAPIFLPLILKIGMDPIQFGVVITLNLTIGLLTPPVGGILFVVSTITKVPIERIVKRLGWFLIADCACLFAVTYIPWLTTWLPHLLMG